MEIKFKTINLGGEDYVILIDEQGMFKAKVGEVDVIARSYETLRIEMDDARLRAAKSKAVQLKLECLDGRGAPVVITGIHAGNGGLLTKPKDYAALITTGWGSNSGHLFPNTLKIADMIKAHNVLADQYKRSVEAMTSWVISTPHRHGMLSGPEQVVDIASKVKADYDDKFSKAS